MISPSDSFPTRQRKAAKIVAILHDFIGHDLSNLICLDIGCREGIITGALAEHFRFTIGIDIDDMQDEDSSHLMPVMANSLSFAQGDGTQLPFPKDHFDVIVLAQVYEHTHNPGLVIREIARVLKLGGVIFFSGPNRWAINEEHYHLPLLSWMPRWLANTYIRATRRGKFYDIHPLSFWELKKLWHGFEIHDYAPKLLQNPRGFHVDERVPGRTPSWLAHLLKPFLPNFNWVLLKSNSQGPKGFNRNSWDARFSGIQRFGFRNTIDETLRVPRYAYTQEYYLSECDGHIEFLTTRGENLPQRLGRALKIAAIQPGQRVLDIGCGRGEFALHCAKNNALVWGLDYAPTALEFAKSLPISPCLGFQQADAENLPFADNSFDTIFMLDVVEHLNPAEMQTALDQAYRTLKPGGRLIVHTMPNIWYYAIGYPLYRLVQRLRGQNPPKDPRSRWSYAHLHVNEQNPLKLKRALGDSNFRSRIWLESTQGYSYESNPFVRWIMQMLTRLPLVKWIFCNDIFAIGTKRITGQVGNLSYIAVEALGIHDYGGGRTATLNLLRNLLAIDKDNHYLVILSAPEPDLVARNLQQLIAPTQNRFLVRLWAQLILPARLRQYDLVHFAKNLTVFGVSNPCVVSIYDMTTLIIPQLMPWIDVWYWRFVQRHALKRASQIIAISETTKQDVQTYFEVDPDKISMIYPSIHPRFRPAPEDQIAKIRRQYSLPKQYILHVGRIDRKNNLVFLVEAFADLIQVLDPTYEGSLVIVGGEYAKSPDKSLAEIIQRRRLSERTIFAGRVPDADLPALYSGAQLAAITSHHEGFGLAAVEAMACGTPVLANRAGALPEVAGQAALFLDEPDPQKLASAIHEILSNMSLSTQLRVAGIEQARQYQNQSDAHKTLQLYEKIITDSS